jgi:hypothetical protein
MGAARRCMAVRPPLALRLPAARSRIAHSLARPAAAGKGPDSARSAPAEAGAGCWRSRPSVARCLQCRVGSCGVRTCSSSSSVLHKAVRSLCQRTPHLVRSGPRQRPRRRRSGRTPPTTGPSSRTCSARRCWSRASMN